MMSKPTPRPGSVTFLVVGVAVLGVGLVLGFLPVVKCPSQDCYTQVQENRRCLSIAESEGYPESVRRHYEEVLRNWPCDDCHGRGRISLLSAGWMMLLEPFLAGQR